MNNKAIALKSQYKLDWRISLLERLLSLFKPIEQMIHGFMSYPIFCKEAIPAFEKVTSYVNAVISI